MAILISVIIATHNRASFLEKALDGLVCQTLDNEKYEVLIIDNDSKDDTQNTALRFSAIYPFIRYIYEGRPGSNNARNIGWKNARGTYVAFIDDDAIASPEWLQHIMTTFKTILPEPGIVGGKVIPVWETPKPDWIQGKLLKALSVVDYGEVPRILNKDEYLFSVNMAFQKTLLERFGGFDVKLGRSENHLTSNDEILIAKKIREAGYSIYYVSAASVSHHVSSSRLTLTWFKKRYYLQGYSEALMWLLETHPSFPMRIKEFTLGIYRFLRNPRYIVRLFNSPPDYENLYKKLIAHAWLGYLKGIFL